MGRPFPQYTKISLTTIVAVIPFLICKIKWSSLKYWVIVMQLLTFIREILVAESWFWVHKLYFLWVCLDSYWKLSLQWLLWTWDSCTPANSSALCCNCCISFTYGFSHTELLSARNLASLSQVDCISLLSFHCHLPIWIIFYLLSHFLLCSKDSNSSCGKATMEY